MQNINVHEFESNYGLIHLLFADRDDYIYTTSLLRLDFERGIYYRLKKDGYENVVFVTYSDGSYKLQFEDITSYVNVKRVDSGKGLLNKVVRVFSVEEGPIAVPFRERKVYRIDIKNSSLLTEKIVSILIRMHKTAVVLQMDNFVELNWADYLGNKELCNCYRNQKNSLIIYASLDAKESVHCLTDIKSAFNSVLSPNTQKLFMGETPFLLYEQLEVEMGSNFHVWNQMNTECLQRMLIYGILLKNWKIQIDKIDIFSEFICAWYQSKTLRKEYQSLLPFGITNKLENVRIWLDNPYHVENLTMHIKQLELRFEDKIFKEALLLCYRDLDRIKYPRYVNNGLLTRVAQLEFDDLLPEDVAEDDKFLLLSLGAIQKRVFGVWSNGITFEQNLEYLIHKIEQLPKRDNENVYPLRKIAKMLDYCIDSKRDNETVYQEKVGMYRKVVEYAMKWLQLCKISKEAEKDYNASRRDLLNKLKTLEILEKQYIDEQELLQHQRNIVIADKNCECKKFIKNRALENISEIEQIINNIEYAISVYTSNDETIALDYNNMIESVKKQAILQKTYQDMLADLTEEYESTCEETQRMDTTSDAYLDSRVSRILEREKMFNTIN